jgi:porin
LTFDLIYSADFFHNTRGGINTSGAFQYRGLLEFSLEFDTAAAGAWEGGTFFVNGLETHGTDISQRFVGDLQAINNADAPNRTTLFELWYQHAFFDDRLRLKLGKIDVNANFAAGVHRGEFVHSSAGFSPNIPLISYPDTAMGIEVLIEPSSAWYAYGGLFDARGRGRQTGFDTAFHSPSEAFAIAEVGIRPKVSLLDQAGLPGQYCVGAWYHGGRWERIEDDLGGRRSARLETGNAGVYFNADQLLLGQMPEDGPPQGLGAFFQFSWAPSDRNEITQHYGAGLQYYGPGVDRPLDVIGLGLHHASLSGNIQSLEQRYSETAIELFYKFQVTDTLSVTPDLHYVINPGGDGRDALVAGVRIEWAL